MSSEFTHLQARAYARQGWFVLPLKPKTKEPHFELIRNGFKSASTDLAMIDFWFTVAPDANYGISCAASGLVVLDIDFRNGGKRTAEMSDTYTVQTGNGLHLYYRAPASAQLKGKLNNGVDVKHHGYVVAAPSIHPNGKTYTILNEMAPTVLPASLIAQLVKGRLVA
ncbi:Prim_Pol domain containing protein [uncultured Caudovirales phage]|uniref:Prim_Pol domain containing protein n=1 Tax=uncultured Caudovirales phage TaxID=2100421 RepID=A0A6J5SUD6_9CAUD|nr:Prim_Pol domain containing protein [uncultured Caudovirales phage]